MDACISHPQLNLAILSSSIHNHSNWQQIATSNYIFVVSICTNASVVNVLDAANPLSPMETPSHATLKTDEKHIFVFKIKTQSNMYLLSSLVSLTYSSKTKNWRKLRKTVGCYSSPVLHQYNAWMDFKQLNTLLFFQQHSIKAIPQKHDKFQNDWKDFFLIYIFSETEWFENDAKKEQEKSCL